MTYTFLSANTADPDHTSAVALTREVGAVAMQAEGLLSASEVEALLA